jgi:dTDP-glucose 4,6-dehydratase
VRILVIGSNSFSGSDFVDHALNLGHDVLGISRSPELIPEFRRYGSNENLSRFSFKQLNINNLENWGFAGITDFEPELVVNYSAQSMVAQSWDNPQHWYQTNVVALSQLANYLAELPSLRRYVHFTTPEVYGSTAEWIKEGEPINPSTPYAVSRAAGDMHLRIMHREKGFPVIFTRAANVYGAGQQLYRVVPKAFLSAINNVNFPLQGGGLSRRSFIHITDVSHATMQIALNGNVGEDYHISTDELVTIRELVSQIYEICEKSLDFAAAEVPDRLGKDAGYFLSSAKIRAELGWNPKVSLSDGLGDVFTWVLANNRTLSQMPWEYEHRK